MTSGIHEHEYSRLPVLINMNNVFKYKCVSNLQVKPGYTRKSPGIPEKYPGSTSMPRSPTPRAPVPTAARPACSSVRTAPCAVATSARGRPQRCARHGLRCGRRGGPNVHLQDRGSARHELLRSEQLIAKKRRNKLAAADKAICYLTRGKFRVDRHDESSCRSMG